MKIHTQAIHSGERKPAPPQIGVATPIYTAASFVTDGLEEQDRIFGGDERGYAYQRYMNPTNVALEEQITAFENGFGALATASGMSALQIALTSVLLNRPKSVICARDIYGATIKLLSNVMEPFGLRVRYVDTNDLAALDAAIAEQTPGAVVVESISNPVLRVSDIDAIAARCRGVNAALLVDNTFATPLLIRPLEHGAHMSIHSLTKFLSGHGDVLGGLVVSDEEHYETMRRLSRIYGPVLGPFESYLAMRGAKTFPLRMERHCANARGFAAWLRQHPAISKVYYCDDPAHPDARVIERLLPVGLYGAMVSFELKDAGKPEIFALVRRLKLAVNASSLGDVHTMVLYPWISSHREVPQPMKSEMGVTESLLRVSVGIEDLDDIIADFVQALG
ncbi:MAG: trans-sulfuration enzyme family protein [Bryobacteraceae bacterium]